MGSSALALSALRRVFSTWPRGETRQCGETAMDGDGGPSARRAESAVVDSDSEEATIRTGGGQDVLQSKDGKLKLSRKCISAVGSATGQTDFGRL